MTATQSWMLIVGIALLASYVRYLLQARAANKAQARRKALTARARELMPPERRHYDRSWLEDLPPEFFKLPR